MKVSFKFSDKASVLLFYFFLMQNGAYRSFRRNCSVCKYSPSVINLYVTSPEYYLSEAFAWSFTPEGPGFWCSLNEKWESVVELFKL